MAHGSADRRLKGGVNWLAKTGINNEEDLIMRNKIKRNKTGLYVATITVLLTLAAIGGIMAVPGTASAGFTYTFFDVWTTDVNGDALGDVYFDGVAEGVLSGRGKRARDIRLYYSASPDWNLQFFIDGFDFGDTGDGTACFTGAVPFVTEISFNKNDGSAHVWYVFYAFGIDGTSVYTYTLDMYGTFDNPDNFPPLGEGNTSTVTLTEWELSIDAKGKASKNACTGSGLLDATVEVAFNRTES